MIDPVSAIGGAASKYFSEVQYIPLETTKESLFGKISQLFITDAYYVILDKATGTILFFNKDGSFHHKLNKFKFDKVFPQTAEDKARRSTVDFMSIAARGDCFYVKSIFETNVLYVYSFEGEKRGKITLPLNTSDYFQLANGSMVCQQKRPYSNDQLKGFNPFDISIIKDSLSKPDFYLPVDFRYATMLDDLSGHLYKFNMGSPDSICLYTPDFSYKIYQFGTTGIQKEFELLFPRELSIPPDFDTDSTYLGKRREYIKNRPIFSCVWGASLVNNALLLDLRNQSASYGIYKLLYSLHTGRLITLDKIAADSSTAWLPVSAGGRSDLLYCDKEHIYYSLPATTLFSAQEETQDKHAVYSPALEQFFKTRDRLSNPVLLKIKLKSTI